MIIPGYRIIREIGKGGMATAYLAIQESLDRKVALKVMAPALVADEGFCQRFLKEGRFIARLNHPHIVTVHDIGERNSLYYMSLEYASAGNLEDRIKKGMSVEEALFILKQVASALGYAHDQHVIHRDVKPANILFRMQEMALLSDFGIAKALGSGTQLTVVGSAVGTPRYMSPEQLMGESATVQSDLYSLGAVFYEMLTGRRPYDSEEAISIALMHLREPLPRLPPERSMCQPIIDRLMAKEPSDRYLSAHDLLRNIDQLDTNATIVMPAPQELVRKRQELSQRGQSTQPESSHQDSDAESLLIPESLEKTSSLGTVSDQPSNNKASPEIHKDTQSETTHAAKRPSPRKLLKRSLGISAAVVGAASFGIYHFFIHNSNQSLDPSVQTTPTHSSTKFEREMSASLRTLAGLYRRVLELDPNNIEAREGIVRTADNYEELAQSTWQQADTQLSLDLIELGLALTPDQAGLIRLRRDISDAKMAAASHPLDEAKRWIRQGDAYLAEARYMMPANGNAVQAYRRALQIDPESDLAKGRLDKLAQVFHRSARQLLDLGVTKRGRALVEQGLTVSPEHRGLLALQKKAE